METSMFMKSFLSAAVTAMVLGFAARATAQTCVADKDCPQGMACNSSTVVNPVGPACKPGTDCPPPPDAAPTTTVVMSCGPKACNTDPDCGDGMICYSWTSTACSGGAATTPCAPDMPCDAGPPVKSEEMCTTTTMKACAFRWQVPCNKDAECGTGFTCKPSVSGTCSGGGGVAVGGGVSGSGGSAGGTGAPPPPPASTDAGAEPPMCNTTTSYPGSCQPTVTSCTADADCPGGWKCVEVPTAGVGVDTKAPAPGGTATPPVPADADAGAPPPATKVCSSPYGGPLRGGKDESAGAAGPRTPGDSIATHGQDGGAVPPPAAGNGATTPAASKSSGGCTLGGNDASGLGAGILVIAALALLRRRRR
jgi:MYXO-CTERM domain-containing protein